jgi:hypothetical protein
LLRLITTSPGDEVAVNRVVLGALLSAGVFAIQLISQVPVAG